MRKTVPNLATQPTPTTMELTTKPFQSSDFPTYQSWYQDSTIARWLGDIDPPWLEYVLTDTSGSEYAFYREGALVGVIGIVLPDGENPHPAITNIAVQPEHVRQGIGSAMLRELIYGEPGAEFAAWFTFVDVDNVAARAFFTASGWRQAGEADEHDMVRYTYRRAELG